MWVRGSFTGIRIGIASAKAISYSLNIPIVAVSSLEALAYNFENLKPNNIICSIIDARNNQVYCGIFDHNYNLLEQYIADDINAVLNATNKYQNIVYVGDGATIHKQLLNNPNTSPDISIHSKHIAKCALKKYEENNVQTSNSIVPLYLRKSQAERMRNKNG